MTIQANFWDALLDALGSEPGLAGVQVLAHPPGENQALKEAVWLNGMDSEFEWRSLGALSRNRTETVRINIAFQVYREAPDQRAAATAVIGRAQAFVAAIEHAIWPDPSVANSVSFGRLATADIDPPVPADKAWVVRGRCVIEAENYPIS